MEANANLWVLDFLLEADGLDDTLIKHFHDVNASQFEELPPNTQARLMLRVLRDAPSQATGISEAAVGALNMLKNLADQVHQGYGGVSSLRAVRPTDELFAEVKTELVLKGLREGAAPQQDHPGAILERYFVPLEEGAVLNQAESSRRAELLDGLKGQEQAQQLLQKYSAARVHGLLLNFVTAARAALGPNMLKIVERDMQEGRYNPYTVTPVQASKRRRVKGPGGQEENIHTAEVPRDMSIPPASMAVTDTGDLLHDIKAETHEGRADASEAGIQTSLPVQGEGSGAANGTEIPIGRPSRTAQPIRRKNGRWNEDETNFLIRQVRENGKGKWKKILEQGGTVFQNRSQVDLKDKWRNLERQGVVGPQDLPPVPLPAIPGQVQMGIPQALGPAPQMGADGQLLGASLLGQDGITQEQYAAAVAAAQYIAGQQQQGQISTDMQHQLAHVSQIQALQNLQQMPGPLMQHPDQQAHHLQDAQQPHTEHAQNGSHLQVDVTAPPQLEQIGLQHTEVNNRSSDILSSETGALKEEPGVVAS